MSAPDTQLSEAVRELSDYATELEATVAGGGQFFAPRNCKGFAADLRTVLAELDRLHNDRQMAVNAFALMADTCNRLLESHGNKGRHDQAKRAALRSVPRFTKEDAEDIRDAARSLEVEIRHRWGYPDIHPANQRKYDRDYEDVTKLNALADRISRHLEGR